MVFHLQVLFLILSFFGYIACVAWQVKQYLSMNAQRGKAAKMSVKLSALPDDWFCDQSIDPASAFKLKTSH